MLTLNFKGYWGRVVELYIANVHVHTHFFVHKYCCCLVAKSCPTLCDPINCSMPGFPVFHYLPEFVLTHVCYVSDAIQSSHPLSPLSFLPSVFPSTQVFSMRKGTPLASRVAQGVSGPSSSCVWNPRVFADDARGWFIYTHSVNFAFQLMDKTLIVSIFSGAVSLGLGPR